MKEGIEMKEGADMTAERGTRDGVVRAVREQKAIAIIRGQGLEVCLRLAEAYAQGGLGLVEFGEDLSEDEALFEVDGIESVCIFVDDVSGEVFVVQNEDEGERLLEEQ